jgi:AcrR family transcriptional regulator
LEKRFTTPIHYNGAVAIKTKSMRAVRNKTSLSTLAESRPDTRTQLIQAAAAEFNEEGFGGTDTNRIARRAGFAPQTFYRWFKDKTDIFIAVYLDWENTERAMIDGLLAQKASTQQLIEATVAHHRNYKIFRRSLRLLSLEDPIIRKARADSRRRQIAQINTWQSTAKPSVSPEQVNLNDGAIAAALLQMERLADALAEGELGDIGISPAATQKALADLIEQFRIRE